MYDRLKINFGPWRRIFAAWGPLEDPVDPLKIDFGELGKLGVYRHDARAFGADPPFFLEKLGGYRHVRAPSAQTLHFFHHLPLKVHFYEVRRQFF